MSVELHCVCGQSAVADLDAIGQAFTCDRCGLPMVVAPPIAFARDPLPPPVAAFAPAPQLPPLPVQPTTVLDTVRFLSRQHALSEAQVVPDAQRCVQCGICSYNCPVGIDVRAHAWRGEAVFDSHCLTCQECVQRCPRGVLRFEQLPLFLLES